MNKINDENLLYTQLKEEEEVYHLKKNEYKSLNKITFKILKNLENGLTVDQIQADLVAEYEISEEKCWSEIKEAIAIFERENIIFPK